MQVFDKTGIMLRLRNWREARNLSARKFAIDAGVDQGHYNKVEAGKMLVTDNMLTKFFEFYKDLDRDYILYDNVKNTFTEKPTAENGPQLPPGSFAQESITMVYQIINAGGGLHSGLPAEYLLQQYKNLQSRCRVALDLLKTVIAEQQAEIERLQKKSK